MNSLTKAEEEVMQVIWGLNRCMVKDIIDELGSPDIPHSTISSVVRILEKKGFVGHKAYGKTHEYYPIITKEEYANRGVNSLIEKYFGGEPQKLVSFLVKKERLNKEELAALMKDIEQLNDN